MTSEVPSPAPRSTQATAHTTAVEEGRRRALRAAAGGVLHADVVVEPEEGDAPGETALAASSAGAPLSELARAFQANADALRALGSMQTDLLTAIQRNDRSEMILASTQSLNDTFRSLSHIQRELLSRLEQGQVGARRAGRVVPLLLLGLVGVVILATLVLLDMGQRFIDAQPDPQALTEHAATLLQDGRDEASASARAEAARVKAQLDESEERLRTSQTRLDQEREEHAQKERALGAKEAELESLRRQAAAAQTEALKMLSLESEIRDLTSKLAVGEPRLRTMAEELEAVRRENARLRRRVAGSMYGLPEEEGQDAPSPTAPAKAASGSDPTPTPPNLAAPGEQSPRTEPEGSRDPRVLGSVRDTLNRLFEAARTGRPDYWQVMRVDAVAHDRLRNVIANRYDAQGRLIETLEAREAYVWVERAGSRVVLEVRDGQRVSGGQRSSLPEGMLTSVIAEGDAMVNLFAQSGLKPVRMR